VSVLSLFNLILPAVCYSCKKRISIQKQSLCYECAEKLERKKEYLTGEIELSEKHFDKAVSLFKYDFRVRNLIHDFKYRGIKEIGNYFSNIAIEVLKNDYPEFVNVDFVVAVPMHKVRQRERSFNQAEYLSKRISKAFDLKDCSSLAIKNFQTEKQVFKDLDKRLSTKSTTPIYKVKDKDHFIGKKVLVIDDVFTSGATANEFSKVLKENGVKKIYVFTIASGNVKPMNYIKLRKKIKDYTMRELPR